MAYGKANIDTIQSSTAGTPPQFNDGNGTQVGTLCRAWVNFNGTGTVAIRASFNVSSITDNGTGNYTINFTTAFADTNYALTGFARSTDNSPAAQVSAYTGSSKTTSAMVINTGLNTTATDLSEIGVAVFR